MTKKQIEEQEKFWNARANEKPPLSSKLKTNKENARLTAFWKAKQNTPYTNVVSKHSSKKGISGFHKGLYMSQRGISKFGDLKQNVPFPN